MTKSRQNEAVDFLRHIRIVPQSVVSSVDQNTVIVDPAGLPFIQGDVAIDKAGGASGAIYETIGIHGFPAKVMKSITAHTDVNCRCRACPYQNSPSVVDHPGHAKYGIMGPYRRLGRLNGPNVQILVEARHDLTAF